MRRFHGSRLDECRGIPDRANDRPTGNPVEHLFRRVLIIHILLASAFASDLPREIRLTNGATLRNCEAVRWEREAVVIRHAGGVAPIRFANIAQAQRSAVESARPVEVPAPVVAAIPDHTYRGQVFVATVGGENFPLGAVTVYAFPVRYLSEFEGLSTTVRLPKPIASAVTDAEGRFALTLPNDEPFFLYAHAGRFLGGSSYNGTARSESYQWIIPSADVKDRASVLLTNTNLSRRSYLVSIEK